MVLAFSYAARSDVGLLRETNQDSGYAGPHLLVLADGMGGPQGGDVASSIAIAHLAPLDGESHAGDLLALLRDAVAEAYTELRTKALADPELQGLGSTVIAALRSGKRLAMAHIGDSRAYLVRAGEVTRLTTDHTYVQHLVDLGQLDPEEAEQHPHRSVVMRVLGDHDLGVDLDESLRELRAGDRFLLCSDGLSSYVSAETIEDVLTSVVDPGQCADDLVDLALRAGGPDNVTVVLADVVELDDVKDGRAPETTPQVVGAATEHWLKPSKGVGGAAGRAAALLARPAAADDAAPRRDPARRRRRWWQAIIAAVLLVALVVAGFLGYSWTQTQYFVGESQGSVAIYRGIPQEVGPMILNEVLEETDIRLEDLPSFARTRLQDGITSGDATLAEARAVVESLREQAQEQEQDQAQDQSGEG
ncbi:PP2C family protein-serine/threonine phosphatase [Serinibacter salmoneus]|uniref:Protein phosphatase n=1 Tax=Serinibacter salmoneus TaxID=556530 RepID=A0A2A9D388_9MICO|nr:PP2C family serine/threonine-protein phosphatase [Serinibacter salmoneus]PFG21124.1 protein phosphatase [Serinibacter salmoneus]